MSVPIRLDEIQSNGTFPVDTFVYNLKHEMQNVKLAFEGYTGTADIVDLRIAVGSINMPIIDGVDFNKATKLGYNTIENDITNDCFMTESDLYMTYKNLYYKQEKNQTNFNMVYCGGTKVKSVTNVWFKIGNVKHTLSVGSDGIPNYFNQSKNRCASEKWSVTEVQNRFHKDGAKYYYEQKTSVDFLNSITANIPNNSTTASTSYVWTNANGTHRATKDAYGILTHNHYDSFGNLTLIERYNGDPKTSARMKKIFNYSLSLSEQERENPISITENGITRKITFKEPFMFPHTSKVGSAYTNEIDYDNFDEKLISVSAKNGDSILAKNTFTFDPNGRIQSLSDQSGRNYKFEYNEFGETSKYFVGNDLLLEKKIQRTNNTDIITEERYRNASTSDTTKTTIDKYGRPKSQKNNSDSAITYTYQDENGVFNESAFAAKVKQIYDPYEKRTYSYNYDDENQPYGYSAPYSQNEEARLFEVRQIEPSKTQYKLNEVTRTSTVLYEDVEVNSGDKKIFIEPRIHRTNDRDNGFGSNDNEFQAEYHYDYCGRRYGFKGTEIITDDYFGGKAKIQKNCWKTFKESGYDQTELVATLRHYVAGEVGGSISGILYNATILQEYTYDDRGNVLTANESGDAFNEVLNKDSKDNLPKFVIPTKNTTYTYDALNRLKTEIFKEKNIVINSLSYEYESNTGNLKTVKNKDVTIKSFDYLNGKRTKYNSESIYYNNYGNVSTHMNTSVGWNDRNQMYAYGNHEYYYNAQGVRFKKNDYDTGWTKHYYQDGNKILGEDWLKSDGTHQELRYFYDADGICGIRYAGYNFNLVRDGLGNVSKVMHRGKLIAEYNYDAWGNCTVRKYNAENADDFVVDNNPFRWKGYYCDLESGLYYIGGRYYDPVCMMYLDADNPENLLINASVLNSLDRNAITVDNSVSLIPNLDNIFPSSELSPDPDYDANAGKSWWDLNWKKAVQWIVCGVLLVTSIVLMCFAPTAAFGYGMLMAGIKGAISGAIIGGIVGGIMSAVHGNGFWDGVCEGVIYGAINGFSAGAIMFCVAQGISAIVNAANKAKIAKQLDPALREYIEMEKSLASMTSKSQLKSFNTATVAYDKTTGQYFYGVNKGFEASGAALNTQLAEVTRLSCAEVQAVNSALNAGSSMNNLYLYTLGINKGAWVAKTACTPCTSVFYGKVAGILTGITP